ncbi:LuxR C-terminal-related transcriptional regulator [Spongiactinospora sp. TRM90649]|uniref:ATP-binding protein n=1 Tax=Spongiactinospora sp. TRM90649 TaxID=3031114 RepID=UPI0023F6D524|nr:LuxR C-terminal-related transcriptional regulator [Spongiactinospora sp. TRM90649]MDF5759206.1 LuxR C-terminal-related transcriptional regulator [Spongiactinospora sp. TRM90649]
MPVEVSEREAEVLAAIGAHLSNAQIASRLHISVRTVESHVSSLLRKFGVPDRRSLAAVTTTGAPSAAPPGRLTGLPAARTSFVGRVTERQAVRAAFDDSRLVTLVGPGGVGKTRLATVAAPDLPYGGVFVDLAPVRTGFVTQAVAAALGVAEGPQQPLREAVTERIGGERSLLVLDNCEHLLDEVAGLADRLLAACPGCRILATSRERIGLPGERIVQVEPLPTASDAPALFADRACAADPGFAADPAAVAEICARLDGMPLAIELAAARSAALGVDGLLTALEDRLRLLTGGRGVDERHRSLRAVVGWSHDLLDDEERALLHRLAVFAGGFDLSAVAAVNPGAGAGATADVLGRLVDKSLAVRVVPGRWRLLETVRDFAAERLRESGELPETRELHLRWAADTASALESTRTDGWQDAFDAVADDLRAALAGVPGPGEAQHRLARSLAALCYARRFLVESLATYREAARRAVDPAASCRDLRDAAACTYLVADGGGQVIELLTAAAECAAATGDGDLAALSLAEAVVTAARNPGWQGVELPHERRLELIDRARAAGNPADPVVAAWLAMAEAWTASAAGYRAEPDLARAAVTAARATGDPVLTSSAMDTLISALGSTGRLHEAQRVSEERLTLPASMSRRDPRAAPEIVDAFHMAARCAIDTGDLPAALAVARRAEADELVGADQYFVSTGHLMLTLALMGDFDEALRHADTAWDAWRRVGEPVIDMTAPLLAVPALVHGLRGDDRSHRVWRARTERIGDGRLARSGAAYFAEARVALHSGQMAQAEATVARLFSGDGTAFLHAYARAVGAELAVAAGLPDAEARVSEASRAAGENAWAAACLARARGRLHGDRGQVEAAAEGWERIGARFELACTLLLLPDRADEGRTALAGLGCEAAPSIGGG